MWPCRIATQRTRRFVDSSDPDRLHTAAIIDLTIHVVLHRFLLRSTFIGGVLASKPFEAHRPLYASAALLTPWRWVPDFWLFNSLLEAGASAGQTFNSGDYACRQNRLLVLHLPRRCAWLVPLPIRRRVKSNGKWRIEVYVLGAIHERWGFFRPYGIFIEWCPPDVHLPARRMLGAELVWKLFAKHDRFTHYLVSTDTETVAPADHCVLVAARAAGVLASLALMPLFFVLGSLSRK